MPTFELPSPDHLAETLASALVVGVLAAWLIGQYLNHWLGLASCVVVMLTVVFAGSWYGHLLAAALVGASYAYYKRFPPQVDGPVERDRSSERIRRADGALRDAFDDAFQRGHLRRPPSDPGPD